MPTDNLETIKQAAELASSGATGGAIGYLASNDIFTIRTIMGRMISSAWLGLCCFAIWAVYPKAVLIALIGAAGLVGILGVSGFEIIFNKKGKP